MAFLIDFIRGKDYIFNIEKPIQDAINGALTGSTMAQVDTYADLPAASAVTNQIYFVRTSTSTLYFFDRKPSGFYYSNGVVWAYAGDFPTLFGDTVFRIYDSDNTSREIGFIADNISDGTTRYIRMPDQDINLADIPNKFDKTGGTISGNTTILSGLTANSVTISQIPTNNNTATQILTRNNTTGTIEYRDVSTITTSGASTADTYVTGFSYNNANVLTITDNSGNTFNVNISQFSGITVNGDATVTGTSNLNAVTAKTITNVDYLDFNPDYTGNTIVEGRMYWDENNGTVSLGMHGSNVLQQIGLEYYYYIKNQSGSTIENGRVVRSVGTVGSSGRILGEYMIADGSVEPKYMLGIATEDILNGNDGYVTEFGLVRGIDTTGSLYGETWADGDLLYVSPTIAGGLTKNRPVSPNVNIEVAIVVHANANGSIFVRPHRYPYLGDIQNVTILSATSNNVLSYDGSLSAWTNTNQLILNSVTANTIFSGSSNINTLFAPTIHTHNISAITNLQTTLDQKFDKTGGTISGDVTVTGNSVLNSMTATTMFSGSSNIDTLFLQKIPLDFSFDGTYTTTSTAFGNIPITIIINSGNTYLNNSTGLTATLYCDISQSDVGINGEFQLYNVTNATQIAATTTTFTSTDNIKASNSFTLTNSDLNKTFRIRMRRTTGTGANSVAMRSAQLIIDF